VLNCSATRAQPSRRPAWAGGITRALAPDQWQGDMLPPMSTPRLQLGAAPTLTRRQAFLALLAGAAAVASSACTSTPPPEPVDSNRMLLESAYGVEATLLAVLAADASQPSRSPLRAQAEQVIHGHLDQLAEVLGGSPLPGGAASADAATDFGTAATEAARAHLVGIDGASPQTSQLLSSLAASDLVISHAFQNSQGAQTGSSS